MKHETQHLTHGVPQIKNIRRHLFFTLVTHHRRSGSDGFGRTAFEMSGIDTAIILRHGLVKAPKDWEYSSFYKYCAETEVGVIWEADTLLI